ncbi:MAG: hypothetical protein KBA46_08205 [Candidatus Omnitrophica bacterium]|nr:hypothetical protein [Candidatus Omnitrophota bacterium]
MNKKGFILLAAVFLVLFLGIFLSLALFRADLQMALMNTRQASSQAFYAAEAGVNRAINELRSDAHWPNTPDGIGFANVKLDVTRNSMTPEDIGFFSVRVTDPQDGTRWIFSTGQDIKREVTRVLNVTIAMINPGNFFISSLSNLTIGSGATINGDLYSRDVIFDVNQFLPESQRKITVNANVSYTRSVIGVDNPDVLLQNEPIKTNPITYTGLDSNRYESLARSNGRFIEGNFNYAGDLSKEALQANNGVVYATGDIHISGDILESVHIVAKGNIYIDGQLVARPTGDEVPQLGLSAGNDVIIPSSAPNDLTIEAFVFADGGVLKAEHAAAQKGTLTIKGSISVRGNETVNTAVNLNAYGNRIYDFNSAFANNMQIPFMHSFVSILNWQETTGKESPLNIE